MREMIVDAARCQIRNRGGNAVLRRGSATRQILDEPAELAAASTDRKWKAKLAATTLRGVEPSRRDHDAEQHARDRAGSTQPAAHTPTDSLRRAWPNFPDEEDV